MNNIFLKLIKLFSLNKRGPKTKTLRKDRTTRSGHKCV
jgi:hypothetical protein